MSTFSVQKQASQDENSNCIFRSSFVFINKRKKSFSTLSNSSQSNYIHIFLSFQQITCVIENFEFEYDDIGNSIDAAGNQYAESMHFPSTNVENPVQNYYYKYPVTPRTTSATMQHIQHTRPTVCKQCTSNAAVYTSVVEPARPKLTYHVVNPAQANVHIDKRPAQTEHTVHVAPPNNFISRQQAIIVNPAPVSVNRPNVNHAYYSQMTPNKYMVRPIYVRLVKPSQGKLVASQMALNRLSPVVQTHHATLRG